MAAGHVRHVSEVICLGFVSAMFDCSGTPAQQRRDGSCMSPPDSPGRPDVHHRAVSKSVPGSRVPYLVNECLEAAVRRAAAAARRRACLLLPARRPSRHRRGLGPAHRLLGALAQGVPCQRRRSADADSVHGIDPNTAYIDRIRCQKRLKGNKILL